MLTIAQKLPFLSFLNFHVTQIEVDRNDVDTAKHFTIVLRKTAWFYLKNSSREFSCEILCQKQDFNISTLYQYIGELSGCRIWLLKRRRWRSKGIARQPFSINNDEIRLLKQFYSSNLHIFMLSWRFFILSKLRFAHFFAGLYQRRSLEVKKFNCGRGAWK